jgi:hypothetical protein
VHGHGIIVFILIYGIITKLVFLRLDYLLGVNSFEFERVFICQMLNAYYVIIGITVDVWY